MITLTAEAAEQIKKSAQQNNMQGMPLRIAAKRNNDNGEIQYAMGFADQQNDDDLTFSSEGVDVVVSTFSIDLLDKMVLDYVQLDNGQYDFIFKNPNDPNYQPPIEK